MTKPIVRIPSAVLRHTFICLLLLAALAPAAAAQTLVPVTGQPVPYRLSVPEGWAREWKNDVLSVSSEHGEVTIAVTALDLVAVQNPPPASRAQVRRAITERVMSNDTFHLNLIERNVRRTSPDPLGHVVPEMGTLGGGKAACVSAVTQTTAGEGWIRVCSTVHGGVLYQLLVMGPGAIRPQHESLVARIRDWFVPADMP